MTGLKPSTLRLLRDLHSRREHKITNRKNAKGYWIFARPRVRTMEAYQRLVNFPRAPEAVRLAAQRWIDGALAEARRYSDADYDEVRRSLYPARSETKQGIEP